MPVFMWISHHCTKSTNVSSHYYYITFIDMVVSIVFIVLTLLPLIPALSFVQATMLSACPYIYMYITYVFHILKSCLTNPLRNKVLVHQLEFI